jgi:predicted dehydrogenase
MVLGAIDQGVHRRNIVYFKPPAPPINALLEEQKAFVDAVLNDKPVAVTAEQAIAAIELGELIMQKIAEVNA